MTPSYGLTPTNGSARPYVGCWWRTGNGWVQLKRRKFPKVVVLQKGVREAHKCLRFSGAARAL